MTRSGLFLKIFSHKDAFSHGPPVAKSANRGKAGSEGNTVSSHVTLSQEVAAESTFSTACGTAQAGPPSVASPPGSALASCYSLSMAQKQPAFTKAGNDSDLWPAVVEADVFGSPVHAGDPDLDGFRSSYVQGVSDAATYSWLAQSSKQNIFDEHSCAEHIFLDVPSEMAWQLRCGLDGVYEFPAIGELSASQPSKASPPDQKNFAVGPRCVLEDVSAAQLQQQVQPVLDASTLDKRGDIPETGSKIVVPVAAQSTFFLPFADFHTLDDEMREVEASNFSIISNKPSHQATPGRLQCTSGSDMRAAHEHCAMERATTRSDVPREVVFHDGNTGVNEEFSSSTRMRQMTSPMCLRVVFDKCSGGSNNTIFLAAACGSMVLLNCVVILLYVLRH